MLLGRAYSKEQGFLGRGQCWTSLVPTELAWIRRGQAPSQDVRELHTKPLGFATVGTIVVGVDGSDGSLVALQFALEEARLRRARLRVVHAFVMPLADVAPDPFLLEFPSVPGPELEQIATDLERSARSLIDDALDRVAPGGDLEVEVERRVLDGSPATVLVDEARDGELLVVGSRGHGRVHDLLLGSVSQHCISHALCPVAIVPAPEPASA